MHILTNQTKREPRKIYTDVVRMPNRKSNDKFKNKRDELVREILVLRQTLQMRPRRACNPVQFHKPLTAKTREVKGSMKISTNTDSRLA